MPWDGTLFHPIHYIYIGSVLRLSTCLPSQSVNGGHMLTKKSTGRVAKKSTLTGKKARSAAKAAKKAYSNKESRPASWKKGGREWSRVLGHFGLAEKGTSKK